MSHRGSYSLNIQTYFFLVNLFGSNNENSFLVQFLLHLLHRFHKSNALDLVNLLNFSESWKNGINKIRKHEK